MPRKARRRAWGSVTEVTRGKKYVLRWVENTPEGRKRKSRTVRGTYREACNELARIQVEKCEEVAVPTVGQVYEARYVPWLERKYPDERGNTRGNYERAWRNHCEPRWANVPIDQVRAVDVQDWLDGMSHSNARFSLMVLRRALDFAVTLEQIPSNPFRKRYELPAPSRTRSKEVYTAAQAAAMLPRVEGKPFEAAYIMAAFGGCRTGESLAVRTDDVSAVESCGVRFAAVRIERQAGHLSGEVLDGTKTDGSRRVALVPEPYCDRLFEIRDQRRAIGLEWMCDMGCKPLGTAPLQPMWRKIEGSIPFANLRNSWRTFAQFEWGVGYETLELLMGHRLPGVTGRHYLRPTVDMLAADFAAAYVKK